MIEWVGFMAYVAGGGLLCLLILPPLAECVTRAVVRGTLDERNNYVRNKYHKTEVGDGD